MSSFQQLEHSADKVAALREATATLHSKIVAIEHPSAAGREGTLIDEAFFLADEIAASLEEFEY